MGIKFANNAASTLAGAINASATSISIQAGDGLKFPTLGAGDWFMATLAKMVSGAEVREVIKVTARSGDTLTVLRGQEGTTATTFSSGDRIENRLTAGTMDSKMDTDGGTFTGDVAYSDKNITQAVLKDCAVAFFDSSTTNTIDYANGSAQRWAPATGAQTLAITNWPPSGTFGQLLIEGVNLGAATITWPTINWLKSDGTYTTTFASNGATLQTSGIDFVMLWTRNGGTTIYGKVLR